MVIFGGNMRILKIVQHFIRDFFKENLKWEIFFENSIKFHVRKDPTFTTPGIGHFDFFSGTYVLDAICDNRMTPWVKVRLFNFSLSELSLVNRHNEPISRRTAPSKAMKKLPFLFLILKFLFFQKIYLHNTKSSDCGLKLTQTLRETNTWNWPKMSARRLEYQQIRK